MNTTQKFTMPGAPPQIIDPEVSNAAVAADAAKWNLSVAELLAMIASAVAAKSKAYCPFLSANGFLVVLSDRP